MIFVVEIYRTGANVFKTGANFLTYDAPDPERLGHRIFWTADEARLAHAQGAAVFGDCGPEGYRAFLQFESFLQDQNVIAKPAVPKQSRKAAHKRKPKWG